MTLATIVTLAAEGGAHHGNVQAETFVFGVIAMVGFLALALVTLSFRNVANRHAAKADAYAKTHAAELQAPHGHH